MMSLHDQGGGGGMNSSIAPIGIARRMILAIVTSRDDLSTLNGFIERNCFVVSRGKSRDVAMKRPKVCVYLLVLYSKIAIYPRKEHFQRKKSRTSRDRPYGTTHTGASLETHN